MPSNFSTFPVNFRLSAGDIQPAPEGLPVKVFDTVSSTDIATLATNADGEVIGSSLPVPPGTLVRFRVENYLGMAASTAQITT